MAKYRIVETQRVVFDTKDGQITHADYRAEVKMLGLFWVTLDVAKTSFAAACGDITKHRTERARVNKPKRTIYNIP